MSFAVFALYSIQFLEYYFKTYSLWHFFFTFVLCSICSTELIRLTISGIIESVDDDNNDGNTEEGHRVSGEINCKYCEKTFTSKRTYEVIELISCLKALSVGSKTIL